MRKDNESMSQREKFAAACIGGCLALFITTVTAATKAPDAKISLEIEAAREMLDTWSGQSQILEQARVKLARVLETEPQNYHVLKEMARYQIMAGYINSRPVSYGKHIVQIGNFKPGTLKRAEATIRHAIRINPRFAEGYVLLGHIQFQKRYLGESEKALTQAELIGTDDPWLHLNWASVHIARGDYSAAKERWQRVLLSGTSNIKAKSSAYGFLIESHIRAEEHEQVIALYKEQINLNPTNAWLRGNYASYLSDTLGRYDEAIIEARAALKIMNYGMGWKTLAMALYRKWADMVAQGNETDAEKYFQEAWRIYPQLNKVMVYGASEPADGRLAKALITKKGISIDAHVEGGSTALLIATNRNRVKTVQTLLDLNANPNIRDKSGWTPLLSAADEGNTEIVNMLLAKGADIHATLGGMNAAALAEHRGKADLAALLRKRAAVLK